MAENEPRGWIARLCAVLGGPSLRLVVVVAVLGIVGWLAAVYWIDDRLDSYRWVGYVVGLLVALGTLAMAATDAPREATLRAPRERRQFSWSIWLFLVLSLAVTLLSFLSSVGGKSTAPLAWWAAAALAIALLVAAATIASKRVFRLTALAAFVLAVGGLAILGSQEQVEGDNATNIVQFVTDGVDQVIRATNLFGDDVHSGLAVAGSIALGLLLLFGYRELELRNNRQYGTPVEVAPLTGVTESESDALTQRLRERIVDADVEGPGSIPGSTDGPALSKLLTEAKDLPHNTLLAAFVSFSQAVAFPPPGVKVTAAVAKREDGDRKYREASVEVSTRVSDQRVLTTVVTGKNDDLVELIDEVADVVATNVINYSRRTPPWDRWQDLTGDALGKFRRIQHAQSSGVSEPDRSIDELEKALRSSPATGPLRMALAHKYDIMGRRLDALLLHLQTATDYPTWTDSRYRLATSLLMVADGGDMLNTDPVSWERIRDLLCRRYGDSAAPDSHAALREALAPSTDNKRSTEAEDLRKELRSLAVRELDALDRWLGLPWLLWFALRADERAGWRGLLRDGEERKRRRTACHTVLLRARIQMEAADGRPVDALLQELDRTAPWTTTSSPTAHYNAACVYALLMKEGSDSENRRHYTDRALRHLEEALRRGGPELFDRKWLESDPDLVGLRGYSHFQVIVNAFTPEPPVPGTSDSDRLTRHIAISALLRLRTSAQRLLHRVVV